MDTALPLERRMWIATKLYGSIQAYFGHWEAVPELDLDTAFRSYQERAIAAPGRRAFALATLEFVARLRNGHTHYHDEELEARDPGPVGLRAEPRGERWLVRASRLPALRAGEWLRAVDGKPVQEFAQERLRYIAASSPAAALRLLWARAYLFPERFELQLEDGRRLAIHRGQQELAPAPERSLRGELLEGRIAYLAIPHFADPALEQRAVGFVAEHASAAALILDLRGNGGGASPNRLLRALMDRPWRGFSQSSSAVFGMFSAYAQLRRLTRFTSDDPQLRGALDAFAELKAPQLLLPAPLEQPESPLFRGPLFVLLDGDTASAAEDLAMPLVCSGRARGLGEPTWGSTGQPYIVEFGDGIHAFIGAKRVRFPDGAPFEGVGILPDEPIRPSAHDLLHGADPVLARALELARGAAAGG